MKTLKELLIELNACEEAIEWVQDRTIEQALAECKNGYWILWLAKKIFDTTLEAQFEAAMIAARKVPLSKVAEVVRPMLSDELILKVNNLLQ